MEAPFPEILNSLCHRAPRHRPGVEECDMVNKKDDNGGPSEGATQRVRRT